MWDSRPPRPRTLAVLALLFVPPAVEAADLDAAPANLSPKGIYHAVDELRRTGVKFFVELEERRGRPRRVPVTHGFRTGDRLTFTFEINRDAYIYVINQTLREATAVTSAGFTAKRIERVRIDEPPPPRRGPATWPRPSRLDEPRLLFPTTRAGSNNRLKGDRPYPIPHRGHYVMDEQTGLERLYVVIADRPLDLAADFRDDDGRIRGPGSADRLRHRLAEWKENAEVEFVGKGIVHDVASYGVSVDPSQPAVVEIDLTHCR